MCVPKNREKLPLNEVIQRFDLPQVLRHNAKFDMDKLEWLAGEYLREVGDAEFPARNRRDETPPFPALEILRTISKRRSTPARAR